MVRPGRFYLGQALLLTVSAVALLWVFHGTRLDLRLEAPFYDAVNRTFPWRYAWVTKYFVHRHLKVALLVVGVGIWLIALRGQWLGRWPRWLQGRQRRWWTLALSFVFVSLVIGLLRRTSAMHCPWDVTQFGGYAPYYDLLSAVPAGVRAGHCFPAAFVSSGSWLLAVALLWYPEHKWRSVAVGIVALVIGFGLGWVQQMRGAHFLSHTLWSLWLSWLVVLAVHFATGAWRENHS